jgi:EAL domain-containing protein (putative c-di-GMP-specific phosphodiesterase class I)
VGSTPRLASAEALVRWIHPKLGFISPGDFIPLFESNGLIQKVDNYVWHEAAAQIRRWKEEHGTSIPVSVNVSRINILDPELESKLENIRAENGLSPEELMLEVTESAYSENTGRLIEVVERLRQKGFRIEIDDFGAGYSSLNMITSIPVDILKIDMSFIRNMEKDERNLKLVKLIIDIAKFLKVPSIAEGVETESQLATLKKMGCEIIQGFYFSKPVPPKDFVSFFEGEAETRK